MYNASFMGFAPVTNPRIVIVVTINGTEGTVGYGGPTSAPVFREVAAAGLRVMDVPKDLPEMVPSEGQRSGRRKRCCDRRSGFFHPSPAGPSGKCRCCRRPTGGFRKKRFGPADFFSTGWRLRTDLAGPRVPNFQGKTVRNVIEQAAALGIPMEFSGSGIARAQVPEPGAILPVGSGFACNSAASEA